MARFDLELLLNDLKAVAVDNLATKLLAIATEKGDGVVTDPVPTDAYFFQVLHTNAVGNRPVFLYYGAEDPAANPLGPHTAEDYSIFFVVCLRRSAEGEIFETKLLRYCRALKEIFETAFTQNKIRTKILVTSITPTNFGLSGQKDHFVGVGVKVRAVIA